VLFFFFLKFILWLFQFNEHRFPIALKLALGEISARKTSSLLSMFLIGISVFFVTVVEVIKSDFIGNLSTTSASAEKPNLYFLDVQKTQAEQLQSYLKQTTSGRIDLAPITRARLLKINNAAVSESEQGSDEERLRQREQNLTWREELSTEETIVKQLGSPGKLWNNSEANEVSLEARFATRIGAKLGDTLTFDLAGIPLEAQVTSLRNVNWQSLRPNFFIVFKPEQMKGAPHQVLMSVFAATQIERKKIQSEVSVKFPNTTILDVESLISSAADVSQKISKVANGISILLMISGILILISGLISTRKARINNVAILRSLGGTSGLLGLSLFLEFLIIGAACGGIGVGAASAIGIVISAQILDVSSLLSITTPLSIWLALVFIVCVVGVATCLSALTTKPMEVWRQSV
jgi:putative ABC transport system permease protein